MPESLEMIPPPLQLRAIEFRRVLKGGATKPFLVVAQDQDDNTIGEFVLKLKQPTTEARAHFGATSLACELICAILARFAGLCVPDYAIIEIPRSFADRGDSDFTRRALRNNIGLNFGARFHRNIGLSMEDVKISNGTILNEMEGVLSFDAAIYNPDRQRRNPNLLFTGEHVLAIDHSLALRAHEWGERKIQASPLLSDSDIRDHVSFLPLDGLERPFTCLLERWNAGKDVLDFAVLRSYVPREWETRSGDLNRIFRFLGNRDARFPAIIADLRRLVK